MSIYMIIIITMNHEAFIYLLLLFYLFTIVTSDHNSSSKFSNEVLDPIQFHRVIRAPWSTLVLTFKSS